MGISSNRCGLRRKWEIVLQQKNGSSTKGSLAGGSLRRQIQNLLMGRDFSWISSRSEMMALDTRKPLGVSRQRPSNSSA